MTDALARLAQIAAVLPESTREDHGRHASFRVRKRVFAYFLDDHQGDGIVGLVCKAPPGASEALVAADPERFYKAAYLHHRGWVGLRLDTASVDWDEVADLVTDSYVLVAPKGAWGNLRFPHGPPPFAVLARLVFVCLSPE